MRRLPFIVTGLALVTLAGPAAAQIGDTIVITGAYRPGSRPSLIVVPGAGLDSVRAIIRRDLDYSDRFETVLLPEPAAGASAGAPEGAGPFNYELYRAFGAQYGVELLPAAGGVTARLHDLTAGRIVNQRVVALPPENSPDFRLEVHALADEITRWATGTPGIAATRLVFVSEGRVYQVDSDGHGLRALTPPGQTALSPVWAPDGRRIAYTRLGQGRGPIVVQDLVAGTSFEVPGTQTGLNITPMFAPDGRTLAYAHSDERGTDIFTANVVDRCCVQRLTVGRFADNLSPTYSPDGRRIAFVSTRAGPPQIYVMAADGTDQELLAPFDYGATGSSNAPEWSPDGSQVVFHREVSRSPQIFVVDVAGRRVRQLTSDGRNEDPTWAPDGRHVAFVSNRTGRRQIWIIDIVSGRVRQIMTPGAARLPAWSRWLGRTAATPNP